MNDKQAASIRRLCDGYKVPFDETAARFEVSPFDLPAGYVAGWIGAYLYVGVSPEGDVTS